MSQTSVQLDKNNTKYFTIFLMLYSKQVTQSHSYTYDKHFYFIVIIVVGMLNKQVSGDTRTFTIKVKLITSHLNVKYLTSALLFCSYTMVI